MSDEEPTIDTYLGSDADDPDVEKEKYLATVELQLEGEFRSEAEALSFIRSTKADIMDDSAFDMFDVGAVGVKKLEEGK